MNKTIMITPDFPPSVGGIQTYLSNLYYRSPKVDVIAPKLEQEQNTVYDKAYPARIYRIKHINAPYKSQTDFFIKAGLKCLIRILKGRYNLIHCGHVFPIGLVGYYAKRIFGIPYVIYTYAMEVVQLNQQPEIVRKAYRRVLDRSDQIVTISNFTRNKLIQMGIDEEKITIIPPGVDTERFVPSNKSEEISYRYGLNDKFVLLTVARLIERKGHDKVIEALASLKNEGLNIVYLIVGSGPYINRLKHLVEEFSLEDVVKFAGYASDEALPNYYNVADTFIMVSREIPSQGDVEGFGIVYLEANSCGKTVIAGNTGGVQDSVVDGETGILVDSLDTLEIQNAILKCYHDSDFRVKTGKQGRQRVLEKFSWDAQAKKVLQVGRK